ncbi:glutamine amidotransferase [Agrobacterium tumefaciens]|uniref:glutamine amidotransferase n=1 Tax=Agrobacterium tumefaciens TaxID=358 RepID=UPI003AF495EE
MIGSRPSGASSPSGPAWSVTGRASSIGVPASIPYVLGLNRVQLRSDDGSINLVHCESRGQKLPLLSVRQYESGRTLAWTTDIAPHWLSDEFMRWDGYDALMVNMVRWLAQEI